MYCMLLQCNFDELLQCLMFKIVSHLLCKHSDDYPNKSHLSASIRVDINGMHLFSLFPKWICWITRKSTGSTSLCLDPFNYADPVFPKKWLRKLHIYTKRPMLRTSIFGKMVRICCTISQESRVICLVWWSSERKTGAHVQVGRLTQPNVIFSGSPA